MFQPQYRESSSYMTRFQQCLGRAVTLIKNNVNATLQNAALQAQPKKVSLHTIILLQAFRLSFTICALKCTHTCKSTCTHRTVMFTTWSWTTNK